MTGVSGVPFRSCPRFLDPSPQWPGWNGHGSSSPDSSFGRFHCNPSPRGRSRRSHPSSRSLDRSSTQCGPPSSDQSVSQAVVPTPPPRSQGSSPGRLTGPRYTGPVFRFRPRACGGSIQQGKGVAFSGLVGGALYAYQSPDPVSSASTRYLGVGDSVAPTGHRGVEIQCFERASTGRTRAVEGPDGSGRETRDTED